jgi:hypothetical protein
LREKWTGCGGYSGGYNQGRTEQKVSVRFYDRQHEKASHWTMASPRRAINQAIFLPQHRLQAEQRDGSREFFPL